MSASSPDRLAFATFLLGACSSVSFAASGVYVKADNQETVAGATTFPRYNTTASTPVMQPSHDSFAYNGAVIDLVVSASFGVNRIFEEINVTRGTNTSDFGAMYVTSYWADNLTIGKVGQTGTGTFSASVHVSGTFLETLKDAETNNIRFSTGLTLNGAATGVTYLDYTLPPEVNQTLTLTNVPFTFGVPFEISVEMIMNAQKTGSVGSSRFVGDAGNSVTWQGISQVKDGSGAIVTGYTAIGSSGTGYTQAIPEPAAGLLLGLGAVGAALRRRRA